MARFVFDRAYMHHEEIKAADDHPGREHLATWFAPTLIAFRALIACLDILDTQFRAHGADSRLGQLLAIARSRMGNALKSLRSAQCHNPVGTAKRVGRALGAIDTLIGRLERFCFDLASPRGAIGHLERHVRGPDRRENLNRAWSSSELDIQVNRLLGAETDLEDWIPPVLRLPSAAGRLDWFLRFNTDGLFKLILLRRLDDVLDRFPWLSARMALVSHVPLGLLGVMAQLFELGRT